MSGSDRICLSAISGTRSVTVPFSKVNSSQLKYLQSTPIKSTAARAPINPMAMVRCAFLVYQAHNKPNASEINIKDLKASACNIEPRSSFKTEIKFPLPPFFNCSSTTPPRSMNDGPATAISKQKPPTT